MIDKLSRRELLLTVAGAAAASCTTALKPVAGTAHVAVAPVGGLKAPGDHARQAECLAPPGRERVCRRAQVDELDRRVRRSAVACGDHLVAIPQRLDLAVDARVPGVVAEGEDQDVRH